MCTGGDPLFLLLYSLKIGVCSKLTAYELQFYHPKSIQIIPQKYHIPLKWVWRETATILFVLRAWAMSTIQGWRFVFLWLMENPYFCGFTERTNTQCAQCLLDAASGFKRNFQSWSQNRWHFRQSLNSVMQISWSDNSVQQSAFKTENSLRGDDPYVPIAAENFQEMEGGECLLMSRRDTQINR